MRIKALCIAVLLIIAVTFCGCEVKENPAETDVYSKALYSETSEGSSVSETEVDVSHKPSETSSSSYNSTDSDMESSSAVSSVNNSSSGTSSVTRVTEITTYYYYYETEETDTAVDTEAADTETESTDSETDTETESDSEITDSDSEDVQTDSENTDIIAGFDENDLDFVIGEARIKLGDIISDFEEVLGEPIHVTDITNAEGELTGKTYSYEDFSIDTVPDEENENDIISSIEIFSDNISTEKGIKIGMGIDAVTSVYGSEWMLYEDEYCYYIGKSYMYFYVQNDIVANIGYKTDKDMEN